MDEQMIKRLLDSQTHTLEETFKHHTSILIEDVTKQVQTVAEGHVDIIRRLDRIDNRLDHIETLVANHDLKLKIVR
jgi:hypothetical protein